MLKFKLTSFLRKRRFRTAAHSFTFLQFHKMWTFPQKAVRTVLRLKGSFLLNNIIRYLTENLSANHQHFQWKTLPPLFEATGFKALSPLQAISSIVNDFCQYHFGFFDLIFFIFIFFKEVPFHTLPKPLWRTREDAVSVTYSVPPVRMGSTPWITLLRLFNWRLSRLRSFI